MEMLQEIGSEAVAAAILDVRDYLHELLAAMGFEFLSPSCDESLRSGIVTARHPKTRNQARCSPRLRKERSPLRCVWRATAEQWLRFSMHFYNTREEMDRIAAILRAELP